MRGETCAGGRGIAAKMITNETRMCVCVDFYVSSLCEVRIRNEKTEQDRRSASLPAGNLGDPIEFVGLIHQRQPRNGVERISFFLCTGWGALHLSLMLQRESPSVLSWGAYGVHIISVMSLSLST